MRVIRTQSIRDGLILGRTISVTSQVLLNAGATLRRSFIEPLLRHGIAAVYVMDDLAPDIVPEDVVTTETRESVKLELKRMLDDLRPTFAEATAQGLKRFNVQLQTDKLSRSLDRVVKEIQSNPTAIMSLQDIRATDEYTLDHSVGVCVLSVLLASVLGYTEKQLMELALGTVLHDIGKITTPPEILNKPSRLTPEEFSFIAQHTTVGYYLLFDQHSIPLTATVVALQHHERWEGGGYPHNLKGEQIYRNARICTIADCFDAMTTDRVYRKGFTPAEALDIMTSRMPGHFQPELLIGFLQCVAPYPVGSLVEITGGQKAVVTKVKRGLGTRPYIRIVLEANGTKLATPRELNLEEHPHIQILRTVESVEEGLFPDVPVPAPVAVR